jgi:hypothetical protein
MMRPPLRTLAGTGLIALAGLLAACAGPAQKESMVAPHVAVAKKFEYSVAVHTSGGTTTEAAGPSSIADSDLRAAIESSITQSGLFKSIVQGSGGDYALTVALVQINRPMFGASMTVDLEASWTLAKASDHSVAWRKSIRTTHTTGALEAFAGVERLRLAVEGAARANITQGLQQIGELGL